MLHNYLAGKSMFDQVTNLQLLLYFFPLWIRIALYCKLKSFWWWKSRDQESTFHWGNFTIFLDSMIFLEMRWTKVSIYSSDFWREGENYFLFFFSFLKNSEQILLFLLGNSFFFSIFLLITKFLFLFGNSFFSLGNPFFLIFL